MPSSLQLVSHHLCPYVQRAAIVAAEKGVALERIYVDLAAKPDWFLAISPTGKVPLLRVQDDQGAERVLFESGAIAEYLDETTPGRLMPEDPLDRARHRAFVEFASGTLNDIAGLYGASEEASFHAKERALAARFAQMEANLLGPWFDGERFGLVDAAWGPVFRYLDSFEALADLRLAEALPKVAAWRRTLSDRPTVAGAVTSDYPERLRTFLLARGSHLAGVIAAKASLVA